MRQFGVMRHVFTAVAAVTIPVAAHADWWWPFGPKDYEECAENAAKDAKTKAALDILLFSCDSKFRGRRRPTGGYTFYDSRQNRLFDIKGPNPTPAEAEFIDKQYSTYVASQAENERIRQEELRRQEREAATREREAAIARAELQKRQQIAVRNIELSANIQCVLPLCTLYKLTIGIRNNSTETVSGLSFDWVFLPSDSHGCPTSLPTKRTQNVRLAPNSTTAINIDGQDGPSSAPQFFRYCVKVTGAEIVP